MTNVPTHGEPELVELRSRAQQLANSRRERLNSAHLLVAMVDQGTIAADLLRERRLTREMLVSAARSSHDDEPDPLRSLVQRAREIARGMRAAQPTALHLLIALLQVKHSAAFRALDQCGVDIHRLRVAAINFGVARAGRREENAGLPSTLASTPLSTPVSAPIAERPRAPARRPSSRAVSVPVMQPVRPVASSAKTQTPSAPYRVPSAATSSSSAAAAVGRPKRTPRKQKRSRFALDPKRFRLLGSLGRNLCLAAEQGELEPVVGRDAEIERLLDVLAKREANNPCLVGLSGVGKTSIVRALAQRIALDERTSGADQRIVLQISVGELLAGAQLRGALAQRLAELKQELAQAEGRVVLFFDDLQQIAGSESTEELMGELRRGLSSGELRCLGTTTPEEYQRVVESDPALCRYFSRIDVEEPELDDACAVLESLAPRFVEHHGIGVSRASLTCAVAWSARYVTGRALPEKAISIVDLAMARSRRRGLEQVAPEQVAAVVSELTEVPSERLLESDGERMLRLEQTLAERVVGHEPELSRIASILRRNAAGLGGQRPIGTFLLLGPTGVGKTETAKAIASALFGSEHAMTRLDLSEYSEAHAVARMIGAPPGYVGHEAGGQLTEAVRKRPYQVLLLDEIEKAHQDVLQTFLPLFDEGRLTDGRGRTCDFSNTVIVLTSNLGARETSGAPVRRLGFGQGEVHQSDVRERVVAAARAKLSPEFYNRLDEVLVFGALSSREIESIARRLLQRLADTVFEQREIELEISPSVVALLLERGGFEADLGARPMKRAIARLVEAPLAEALLSARFDAGARVAVTARAGTISFERAREAAAE